MTTEAPEKDQNFTRESSRIGINLAALVASRIVSLVLSLVQTAIIMRALEVEGRGLFVFALGYSSLFTALATLGIHRLLVRDISRNPDITWTYLWTAEAVVAVLSAVAVAAIGISIWVLKPDPQVRATVLLAASSIVLLWALQRPFEAILVARERMVLLALLNLAGGVLRLTAVYFVIHVVPTTWAAHGAIAIGNLIAFGLCIATVIAVAGRPRSGIRLSLALEQIRECIPFTVAMLCSLIYFKSDISILTFLRGETATGVYAPTQRLTEPIMMIAALWGTAVFPALCRFSVGAPENYAKLRKTSLRLALLFALPLAFGMAALAEPIMVLLTGDTAEECAETILVLRLACAAIPLFYLNGVAQESFYASHRNWFVVMCYASAAVVSVAGNLIAIPVLGVPGVPVTAIAANLTVSILFLSAMKSQYAAMGLASLVAKTLIACAAMAGVTYGLARVSLVGSVLAGCLVYGALQLLFRTLNAEEHRLLCRLVRLSN